MRFNSIKEKINKTAFNGGNLTVIEVSKGWAGIHLKEIWNYRDLFYFFVWRDIKSRYAQSILGIGWAVIQPIFSMIVFTVIFGKIAEVGSDGVPYVIFSYVALVPWTYISNGLISSSTCLISASEMIGKIYFPRIIIPVTPTLARLVDFAISVIILLVMMVWFGIKPTASMWALPGFILLMIFAVNGIGLWVSALAVRYRDVKFAMTFIVQLLMYAAPVVYPLSRIPDEYRWFYGLNPFAGLIEGFRVAFLGTNPIPWDLLLIGSMSATMIAITGMVYFHHLENSFADVI